MARLLVLSVSIIIYLLDLVFSLEDAKSSIISEVCIRALTEGTFSGKLTSFTWEGSPGESLDSALLLLVFAGSGGLRIAQENMHHDNMLISEADDSVFHIDEGLLKRLAEITLKQTYEPIEGMDKANRLPLLGYYTIRIKELQPNAGEYIFLFNKLWMLRKTVGKERMTAFYNYTLFSTIHGQAEKDVISGISKCIYLLTLKPVTFFF